jgi:hypothetical protein
MRTERGERMCALRERRLGDFGTGGAGACMVSEDTSPWCRSSLRATPGGLNRGWNNPVVRGVLALLVLNRNFPDRDYYGTWVRQWISYDLKCSMLAGSRLNDVVWIPLRAAQRLQQ